MKSLSTMADFTIKNSVGNGGVNNREDVVTIEKLLNRAIVAGAMPGHITISEDGKIDPLVVNLIGDFQRKHFVKPASGLINSGINDPTYKQLLKWNRWHDYDDQILQWVTTYNQRFAATSGFVALDWRYVKAMMWLESGGPDYSPQGWKTNPMQLSARAGDHGLDVMRVGGEHTDLLISRDQSVRIKKIHKISTPADSFEFGILWLYRKAFQVNLVEITDSPEIRTHIVAPHEILSKIAKTEETTEESLLRESRLTKEQGDHLRIKQVLHFKKAHREYQISGWQTWKDAIIDYNGGGNPNYGSDVDERYQKIAQYFK